MSTAAPAAGEASVATAPAAVTDPAPQSTALRAVTPAAAVPRCDNCGANVPERFCGTCGQRLEPPIHSLWHFIGIAAEDVTHADSRLWRTLAALLFKPGFLTREFLEGRRARYLPPVRLYLVLSVVFFVVLRLTGHTPDEARATPAASATSATPAAHTTYSALEGDQEHCKLIHYNGPWQATLLPLFVRSCTQAAEDHGRSLVQSFLHNLPRAMFLFLPLLAGVMKLLYWHPRHYYVEHLLFCVHNHAFAFLVVPLAVGLSALLPFAAPLFAWVTALYITWYLYRSMRVMYGQGPMRTVAKLGVLSFVYLVAGSLMLAATALYAFVTL